MICCLLWICPEHRATNAGKDWGVERESYTDPVTGVCIWELTRGPSASDNLYFHFCNLLLQVQQKVACAVPLGSILIQCVQQPDLV